MTLTTKQATALTDLSDGLAGLQKAAADLGITKSATSVAGVNAQIAPLAGGVNVSNAKATLGPLLAALQGGGLTPAMAAQFASQFGGNSSALGVDLGSLASGKLSPTDQDARTKATELLVEKIASLIASVDKNTSSQDAGTAALEIRRDIYGKAPGSALMQLDYSLTAGPLPVAS